MRTTIILLAMVSMILLSGCATTGQHEPSKGWTKQDFSKEEFLKDLHQCQEPKYIKEDMVKYEADIDFCIQAEMNRKQRANTLSMVSSIASEIVRICASGLEERCMTTKGYVKNLRYPAPVQQRDDCMKQKGYEWK